MKEGVVMEEGVVEEEEGVVEEEGVYERIETVVVQDGEQGEITIETGEWREEWRGEGMVLGDMPGVTLVRGVGEEGEEVEEGGIYITPDKISVEEMEEGDEVEEVEEGIVEDDGIKYETHMVAL